jgi:hypothetical protein
MGVGSVFPEPCLSNVLESTDERLNRQHGIA